VENGLKRCHGLVRGEWFKRCHGLVPWSLTITCYPTQRNPDKDATGSPRGVFTFDATLAVNVNHGTSPWHPGNSA
jgi:hypothetical protein